MITREEIQEALDQLSETKDESIGNLISDYLEGEAALNGLKFEVEEQFGGEGQGDHCHYVYKVTKGKKSLFIKFDGYYDSNNGSDYDGDFNIVEPYMKQVRDWKNV